MLGAMDKRVSEEVRAPEQPLKIPKKGFFFPPGGQQPPADSPQASAVASMHAPESFWGSKLSFQPLGAAFWGLGEPVGAFLAPLSWILSPCLLLCRCSEAKCALRLLTATLWCGLCTPDAFFCLPRA